MLIPYEDKVDVITPANILFRGVPNFTVMMIMMTMMTMMMMMMMTMMIVSVEQRPGWGGHFVFFLSMVKIFIWTPNETKTWHGG